MKSIHLLLLNLIYDCCCTAIPWDNVDADYLKIPREWDASLIGSFMIWMGPTSSVFDLTTYLFMYFIFCPLFVSHGILYTDLPAHSPVPYWRPYSLNTSACFRQAGLSSQCGVRRW